jgi:hypothetical protein
MTSINSILKGAVELGFSVVLAFILLDILFPGSTGIVSNLSGVLSSFSDSGVVGLFALLLFLLIIKK